MLCGIEAEPSARETTAESVRDCIVFGETFVGRPAEATFDLACCVEVLEHIPESEADRAVDSICAHSRRWVYFSAAAPGQPGKGHVNCQPKPYWRRKFEARGFRFAEGETAALVDKIRDLQPCQWLPQNAMIFERAS